MRALLLVLIALSVVNCSGKKFSTNDLEEILDENGIDLPDDPKDDDLVCPRYDLVVKSNHVSTKKLNFKFVFNGEVKHKSGEGEIALQFLQDGNKKFTQCSGDYNNTTIALNLQPLQAVEDLTAHVEITHGKSCATVVPDRTTYIEVIDSATNTILWDEKALIDDIGSCEFGYSSTGEALRSKILNLADEVADKMAAACNK